MDWEATRLLEELSVLKTDFDQLKNDHGALHKYLEDFYSKQPSKIAEQMKTIKNLRTRMQRCNLSDTEEHASNMETMEKQLLAMRSTLPQKNSFIIKAILGDLNVQLRNQEEKFHYKERYEIFKLRVTILVGLWAVCCLFFPFELAMYMLHFMLVWYYATVTIREHILRANGSRIRSWWLAHHYLSLGLSAMSVTLHDDDVAFKEIFLYFTIYISFVQFLQFYYQRSSLVRLVTLGRISRTAEVTAEGPRRKTFTDLQFLLPFLIGGYMFQFYNAYFFGKNWLVTPHASWQVLGIAIIFALLGLGNSSTTLRVYFSKVKQRRPSISKSS